MPTVTAQDFLPKNRRPDEPAEGERPLGVAWVTVVLGGLLVLGNVLELGGVQGAACEWSAWMLAGLVLAYGVSLGLEGGADTEGLRLPRLPLIVLPFVVWLGFAWWHDTVNPWAAQQTFFLAAQAWLLAWVVAATPGERSLSWAWLIVVGVAAAMALVAAVAWQHGGESLWLPLERELPAEWMGRWSGTLPTPAALGGLLVLGGAPLLVLGLSRRLAYKWRMVLSYAGVILLTGAVGTYSLGAWLGILAVWVALPWVIGGTARERRFGLCAVTSLLVVCALAGWYLTRSGPEGARKWILLQAGEPAAGDAWTTLHHALQNNLWLGGRGQPYADLSRDAGAFGRGNGWAYGFGDWSDLAATWGLVGFGLAALAFATLLAAGWLSWAKLPFSLSGARDADDSSADAAPPESPTPETKVLLGAATLGLTGFAVTMLAARTLNIPALVYALAVVAGVISRNVPQRGGLVRLPPLWRWTLGLGVAAILASWTVGTVAPAARAQIKLDQAVKRLELNPPVLRRNPNLLPDAEVELLTALAADPSCAPAWTELARLQLEKSTFDPVNFEAFSQQAGEAARRALLLAPDSASAHAARALARLLDNHFADATRHALEALELAPTNLGVQYDAVAIFALDPAHRPDAQHLIEIVRHSTFPREHFNHLEEALKWAETSTIPLLGRRQRSLPPFYQPPAIWPPLDGVPEGTHAATVRANLNRPAAKPPTPANANPTSTSVPVKPSPPSPMPVK